MNLQKITDKEEKALRKNQTMRNFSQTMKFYARYGYDWYLKNISIKGLPDENDSRYSEYKCK